MAVEFRADRREFIGIAAGALACVASPVRAVNPPFGDRRALCSGRSRQFATGVANELAALEITASNRLREVCSVELPSRAHGIVAAATRGEIIVCSRRPGAWLLRIRLADGAILAQYVNDDDRWLQGHACLSADGGLLFAGEVDLQERSTIAIFDSRSLRRIGAIPSGGIEPHELLCSEESVLLIAHGGRRNTLRGDDATTMNSSCESTLTWLDYKTGHVLRAHRPSDDRVSLRHLAPLGGGRYAVGAQSGASDILPMIAIADDCALHWLKPDKRQTTNYIASVAADRSRIIASAPRDDCVYHWRTASDDATVHSAPRAFGACIDRGEQWISCESGVLGALSGGNLVDNLGNADGEIIRWDNHMVAVPLS